MVFGEDEFALPLALPSSSSLNILGHVDIRVTQNVPQNLTSSALASIGWNAWRGSSENAYIVH
jgi:hypothetical protein